MLWEFDCLGDQSEEQSVVFGCKNPEGGLGLLETPYQAKVGLLGWAGGISGPHGAQMKGQLLASSGQRWAAWPHCTLDSAGGPEGQSRHCLPIMHC